MFQLDDLAETAEKLRQRDRAVLSCKCFMAGLSDYLDDVLDAATRSRFDRHLADCPSCRIVYETTRKTVELYKEFLPCRVSPALESRLMAAIRTRMTARHHNRSL